jgi:hypothetical protein
MCLPFSYSKEHDLERVRSEVHALIGVILLLSDDVPAGTATSPSLPSSAQEAATSRTPAEPTHPESDLADLERFYPFVRHMSRNSR